VLPPETLLNVSESMSGGVLRGRSEHTHNFVEFDQVHIGEWLAVIALLEPGQAQKTCSILRT
jgi:hypothetical protein